MSRFKYTENQEAWLADLESGDIKQCKGVLGLPTGERCCLGVACDLAGVPHREIPRTSANGDVCLEYGVPGALGDKSVSQLPHTVLDWLQMRSTNGSPDSNVRVGEALAGLNDNGKTFVEIAAEVRAYPHAYLFEEGERG